MGRHFHRDLLFRWVSNIVQSGSCHHLCEKLTCSGPDIVHKLLSWHRIAITHSLFVSLCHFHDVLLSAGFEPTLLVHCRTHWMSIIYIRLTYYDVDSPSLYNITSAGFPKQVLPYVYTFNQVSEINWISTSRKLFIETCVSNTLYQHSHTHTHTHTHALHERSSKNGR